MTNSFQQSMLLVLTSAMLLSCGDRPSAQAEAPAEMAERVDEAVPEVQTPASDAVDPVTEPVNPMPTVSELLPEEFARLWESWHGDLPGIIERRAIRVQVPFGGYQFYYVLGRPRGAIMELLQRFEDFVNAELGRKNIRVYVVPIPVSRDRLLTGLTAGHADMVAADLTITEARKEAFIFSRPLLRHINDVVVSGPSAPPLATLQDLSGQEVVVRESSSYFEHLSSLSKTFAGNGLEPPHVIRADELLEAEDILEMVNAGMIPMTVLDDYKADFWAGVFPDLVVRHDLIVNDDGSIAWATRQDSPELAKLIDRFLRKYGKGTLVGNDTFNRYLTSAARVRCVNTIPSNERYPDLAALLQKYGKLYEFDWLMLAAQGYQESGLRQNRRSHAGAIGIMQIKPSTAADRNVGIENVDQLENNIHAGTKYMRFLSDRYFSDDMDSLNKWLFSLAAYNAGPARVARLRTEAASNGYDRNLWFNHVEIIAARRIGKETVGYVSSIYKYYVGYRLAAARVMEQRERHGTELTGCQADEAA